MTDDDSFRLSRRKALAALGTVGVTSAGAGLGTSAYFNDTESFDSNTMTAGELDLKIDWQQTYRNGEVGSNDVPDSTADFVNAHPDHDGDGVQSLGDGEGGTLAEYTDSGRNIQEYITCDTLDAVSVPEDFQSDDYPDQQNLIQLDDVKPGDSGEVTFSFHLCDNPGYVWLTGGNFSASENGTDDPEDESPDEVEGVVELADEIMVRAWYDFDCDNVFEPGDGEDVIVDSPTTLRNFFENRLTNDGRILNPAIYGDSSGVVVEDDQACIRLGKIEWNSDGLSVADDDGVDGEVVYESTDPYQYVIRIEDTSESVEVFFLLDEFEFKEEEGNFSEVTEFDWETLDGQSVGGTTYNSDTEGMCRMDLKSGGGPEDTSYDLVTASACTSGQDNVLSPSKNDQEELQGISYVEFYYCPPDGNTPPNLCFPGEKTYCVGFEWWLPSSVGNEIQTDSVSFDLGFYTEQCRHNGTPSGPGGSA